MRIVRICEGDSVPWAEWSLAICGAEIHIAGIAKECVLEQDRTRQSVSIAMQVGNRQCVGAPNFGIEYGPIEDK